MRKPASRDVHARNEITPSSRAGMMTAAGSDVSLEDRRLGQAREAFTHRSGAGLADAFHGLEVVDGRGEQFLQRAEVVDESVDDGVRQPRHSRQQSMTAR